MFSIVAQLETKYDISTSLVNYLRVCRPFCLWPKRNELCKCPTERALCRISPVYGKLKKSTNPIHLLRRVLVVNRSIPEQKQLLQSGPELPKEDIKAKWQ